jgi:hypothetical protein
MSSSLNVYVAVMLSTVTAAPVALGAPDPIAPEPIASEEDGTTTRTPDAWGPAGGLVAKNSLVLAQPPTIVSSRAMAPDRTHISRQLRLEAIGTS